MGQPVKIIVVGEPQVGKSSIVAAGISERWIERVSALIPPTTLPPDFSDFNIASVLTDTSSKSADWPKVEQRIKEADVIVIVYDVSQPVTFEKVTSRWLPAIRRLRREDYEENQETKPFRMPPIILAGNKIDTRAGVKTNPRLGEEVTPIIKQYPEVETCLECSAKNFLNIREIFFFAERATQYPSLPLFDPVEGKLSKACMKALRRIFHLLDVDKDKLLNDKELNQYQKICFQEEMSERELNGLKDVVAKVNRDSVQSGGLTISGFLVMNHVFVQQNKIPVLWTALRKFGYDEEVELREDFLTPNFEVEQGQVPEISPTGYEFLTKLFRACDKDEDAALCTFGVNSENSREEEERDELKRMFTPAIPPRVHPFGYGFPRNTVTNPQGAVTLQGFLASWSLLTLDDYKKSLRYFAFLGFKTADEGVKSALTLTRPKRNEQVHNLVLTRNIFQAFVFGAKGAGKTTFLKTFINKSFDDNDQPQGSWTVVNSIISEKHERYLVLREFDAAEEQAVLKSQDRLDDCDLAVLLYDQSDAQSFGHIARVYEAISQQQSATNSNALPVVIYATKTDLPQAKQILDMSVKDFCTNHKLPQPKNISLKTATDLQKNEIYQSLMQTILSYYRGSSSTRWGWILGVGFFLAACIAGGAFFWKRYAAHNLTGSKMTTAAPFAFSGGKKK